MTAADVNVDGTEKKQNTTNKSYLAQTRHERKDARKCQIVLGIDNQRTKSQHVLDDFALKQFRAAHNDVRNLV